MSDNVKNLLVVVAAAAILTALGWLVLHVLREEWLASDPAEMTAPADATATPADEPTAAPPSEAEEVEAEATFAPEPEPTPEPTAEEVAEAEPEAVPLSPGDLHARLAPGTVTLEAVGDDAHRRRIGAGFVVATGVVATTRAVAERAERIVVRSLDTAAAVPIERTLRVDRELGLVLLSAPDLSAPALEIDAIADVADGARVYALANADVITGFGEGLVDSIRMLGRIRALTMSVGVPPNLEGGPVADAAGRVIGIATRRPVEGSVEEVVISAAAVRALLEGGGVEADRAPRRPSPAALAPPTARPEPTEPFAEPEPEPTPEPTPFRPRAAEEDELDPLATRVPRARSPVDDEAPSRSAAEERRIAPRDLVVESAAKLYEAPDPSSHVIARLRAGTVVTAVAEAGEWWRIRSSSGRRDGYLSRSVTRSRPRPR